MFYHQVYAIIKDSIVKNIIVCKNYEIANIIARNTYGNDAIAIDCTHWNCAINDRYENNKFYDKDGNERVYIGDEIENINKLKVENEQLKQQTSEDNETILDHEFRLMELEG